MADGGGRRFALPANRLSLSRFAGVRIPHRPEGRCILRIFR